VLGQFTGEDQSYGGLDLAGRDGGLLVVSSKLGSFGSDALEDVVDERVQDGHGTVGDTGVRVNLLQDFVDVGRVSLLSGLGALLLLSGNSGSLLSGLLLLSGGFASRRFASGGGLSGSGTSFWRHFDEGKRVRFGLKR